MVDDVDILARTIYGEARSEGTEGMIAVACVVMNRYKAGKWFTGYRIYQGKRIPSVAQTCLKRWQFSCWNKNDPNYVKIYNVTPMDSTFRQCVDIAQRAVSGELKDITNGATYYHTRQIKPVWALQHTPCYRFKNHLFYNDIDGGKNETT